MNEQQKRALEQIVDANEELKGVRIVIDYAIQFCCEFAGYSMNKEMTDYVEELYKNKYDKSA